MARPPRPLVERMVERAQGQGRLRPDVGIGVRLDDIERPDGGRDHKAICTALLWV